jgi:hypothetical protein
VMPSVTPASPEPAPETGSGDAELDALLAALKADAETPPAAAGAVDPDLAALLADL